MIQALENVSNEPAVYRALISALHNDSSYAVEAAAARALGKSGKPEAFDVLQAEVATQPELHVMQAALSGLVATKDARAAEILLQQARPGVPERIRLTALASLAGLKDEVAQNHLPELIEVVRAALDDSFYWTHERGKELVGTFDLTQFEAEIEKEAKGAAMAMQRESAHKVLRQLRHQ